MMMSWEQAEADAIGMRCAATIYIAPFFAGFRLPDEKLSQIIRYEVAAASSTLVQADYKEHASRVAAIVATCVARYQHLTLAEVNALTQQCRAYLENKN